MCHRFIGAANKRQDQDNVEAEILEDLETIAERVHNAWMSRRLDEGWRLGPIRDDEDRRHPSLVPFDELSEEEKAYDRTTALETIRTLLELGYRIERR